MHELSVAMSLVEAAAEAAGDAGAIRVKRVGLRVGALSGVVPDALRFAYDVAAAGTLLAGSALDIEEVPATVYCAACDAEQVLPAVTSFRCPRCGTPSADLRRGRELELTSLEIEVEDPPAAGARAGTASAPSGTPACTPAS